MHVELSAVLLAIFALTGAGVTLLAILQVMPATASRARGLWRVLGSAIFCLLVISAVFTAHGILLWLAVVAMAFRIGQESTAVAEGRLRVSQGLPLAVGLAAALACALSFTVTPHLIVPVVLPLVLLVALARLALAGRSYVRTLDILLFPLLPLVVVASGAGRPQLAPLFLLILLLVETFDSYAMLGGKLFGKHKAFPTISPGKTIEGLAFGTIALAATAVVAGRYLLGAPLSLTLMTALAAGCLAVLGDLAASRIKRLAGVKDYPVVLKSQGGLLDTLDGWLMASAGLVVWLVISGNELG